MSAIVQGCIVNCGRGQKLHFIPLAKSTMDQLKDVDGKVKSTLNRELESSTIFSKLLIDHQSRIPGGSSGSPEEGTTALILYIVGAVIIAAGLLFYCKWSHAKWKRRNKKYNARITRPATLVSPVEIIEVPLENISTFTPPPAYAEIGISQSVEYESQFNTSPRPIGGVTSTMEHSDLPPPYETIRVPEVTTSLL